MPDTRIVACGILTALLGVQAIAPSAVLRRKDACMNAAVHDAPGQKETQPTMKSTGVSRWKMEIEDRDDPVLVEADLDLNVREPQAVFTTPQGTLRTERGRMADGKFLFHLPDNPQTGAAEGEIRITKDTLTGVLITPKGKVQLHGRRTRSTDATLRSVPEQVVQGPGFRDLMLEASGGRWSLAQRMQFHHVPGVSLARIENFQVVEVGAFGVTDVATGEPMNTDTLFQAGGMGSPLINLLALRLAAQGRLDLDREVNRYLKSAQITENTFTQTRKTTVRDLMNGASGLSQYKFRGYRPGVSIPSLSALLAGADTIEMEPLQPVRVPGTEGGEGVCGALLEQVIVDATGRPFAELMQTNIFTPCRMAHSTYTPSPRSNSRRNVALGHYATGERTLDRFHIYPEAGQTGLWTTAGDFARLLCQVQLLLAGKPNRILTQEQHALLKPFLEQRRILGFIKSEKDDFLPVDYLYHGGASYGYYANHATHPENGTGMVVMENRNLGWGLNNEIIKAIVSSPMHAH